MMSGFTPSEDDFAALETRMMTSIDHALAHRRRRHRLIALGSAIVLAAGAAGTAWAITATPVEQHNSAYCYTRDDPSSAYTQVGTPTYEEVHGRPRDITRARSSAELAESLCASVWQIGLIRDGHLAVPSTTGQNLPVPRLQACLRSDLVLAVFPRRADDKRTADEFCYALNLDPPAP